MPERIGYIGYKLYRAGWRNGLYRNLPPVQHWLLSIFLLYRRGYAEGLKWVKEYHTQKSNK
ncbi:hypothetical protein [Chlorogloeopsis sp. ULAP02]|uniref:hypothetical protein n=1 Tax=Chlorogloeopsis sp. ULAP02 TaxID=3107926 RepID=UPI003136C3BE